MTNYNINCPRLEAKIKPPCKWWRITAWAFDMYRVTIPYTENFALTHVIKFPDYRGNIFHSNPL